MTTEKRFAPRYKNGRIIPDFLARTVRKGQVTMHGQTFRVSERHLKYDGRLDGKRFQFYHYHEGDRWLPFLNLWGTEAEAQNAVLDLNTAPYVVDGKLPWNHWDLEP